MSELIIPERKKHKVTIYGTTYDASMPSVSMVEELVLGSDKPDDPKNFVKSKEMISKLGIPMDVLNGMEMSHFNILVEFLVNAVKKN
jgi:hypothetical protein